jgi:hypothetical protein
MVAQIYLIQIFLREGVSRYGQRYREHRGDFHRRNS